MLFSSINSYFSIERPCLHYEEDKKDFNLHVFYDFPFPILTIPIDKLNENEVEILFYQDIELNGLIKNQLFFPVWKFGDKTEYPFMFGMALDPNAPQNHPIIDSLIQKEYMLVCFTGKSKEYNVPVFKGFRLLSVPEQGHLTMGEYLTTATEQGFNYSLKYFNWIQSEVKNTSILEKYEQLVPLGKYKDVLISEVQNELDILSIS